MAEIIEATIIDTPQEIKNIDNPRILYYLYKNNSLDYNLTSI